VRVTDPNSAWGRVAHFFRLPPAPHLVLLDTGMVATLTPGDQRNLVNFFKARPGPRARILGGGGHLVLLDTGMVATLTPGDQRNLVNFFKARPGPRARFLGGPGAAGHGQGGHADAGRPAQPGRLLQGAPGPLR